MIDSLRDQAEGQHSYWFYGTGFGIDLMRRNDRLDVRVMTNLRYGPVQTPAENGRAELVGHIGVRDWVEAIVSLSGELANRFRDLNPQANSYLGGQESDRLALERWLASSRL